VDRTTHGLAAQNERGFFETRSLINGGFEATLLAGKDGEIATHKNAGDVKAAVIEFGNANLIESRRLKSELSDLMGTFQLQSQAKAGANATAIQLQAATLAAAQRLENDKQFALATLAASTNAKDAALQLANCCCEIKESVASSAKETQALIAAQESARIRDALAAAHSSWAAAAAAAAAHVVPLDGVCHDVRIGENGACRQVTDAVRGLMGRRGNGVDPAAAAALAAAACTAYCRFARCSSNRAPAYRLSPPQTRCRWSRRAARRWPAP
jgi:hypothetical protein